MLIKLTEFIWQDVSIWNKVKMLFAKSFLHSDDVEAEPVFPCDFMALREVIDLLILVQAFIQVALAAGRAPQNVPLVRLSGSESCSLEDGTD